MNGSPLGRGVVTDLSSTGLAVDSEADLTLEQQYLVCLEIPFELKARLKRSVNTGKVRRFGFRIEGLSWWEKFLFKRMLKGQLETSKI